ncbi:MAG: hypothetical protein ACOYB3_01805 [Azonexus sp.]
MSKVEHSQWRCTVPVRSSETGTCDEVVIQKDMEDHLRREHKRRLLSPGDVIPHFVLTRSSDLGRGPGRRGKVDDETMTMFEREDFR